MEGSFFLDGQHVLVYGGSQAGSLNQSVAKIHLFDLVKKEGQEVYSGPGWVVKLQAAGDGTWYALTRQYIKENTYIERVIKSLDHGQTWETIHTFHNTARTMLHSLFFFSPDEGLLFGYSDTQMTRDGGRSWARHPATLLSRSQICSNDRHKAWAVENNKLIVIDPKTGTRKTVIETPPENSLTGPICDSEGNLLYATRAKSSPSGFLSPKIFKLNSATQKEMLVTNDLPKDFLPDQILLSNRFLFVSGARVKSASFWGIQHDLFKIERGKTGSIKSIRLPSSIKHGLIGTHTHSDCLLYFEKDAQRHGYSIYSFECGF